MRFIFLDQLRGLAVIWMIIFHTAYDMRMLGLNQLNFSAGFWYAFPRIIAFSFLLCVGLSLPLAHTQKINWPGFRKRLLKLGMGAMAVSFVTFITFPTHWVYFGTLHCIFFGSLFGVFLVHRRGLAAILCATILLLQYGLNFDIQWVSQQLQKPTMDFIPIYPWFWVILLGILLSPWMSKNRHLAALPQFKILNLLGKHSLKIYLIHQPLIYSLLWIIQFLSQHS